MKTIDLNCDMGELMPGMTSNYDDQIMPYISSCNVACGFHSGDAPTIERTILSAIKNDVKIGAHPSYNDKENFGRISINVDLEVLQSEWRYQISALKGMVESVGSKLHHVKAHGALYNDMVKSEAMAIAFVEVIKSIDAELIIYTMAHSIVSQICQEKNMKCVHEVFADRRYDKLTTLRSRKLEGAVLHDADTVLNQIKGFLNGNIILHDQSQENITAETICLHSDTPGAIELAKEINSYIIKKGIEISATT